MMSKGGPSAYRRTLRTVIICTIWKSPSCRWNQHANPDDHTSLLKGPKNEFRSRLRQSSFMSCCQSISRSRAR